MKATATQYAKTLYELTRDKSHKEVDEVVSNFTKELARNGQMKLASNIVAKFGEVYNAENGIVEAEVVTRSDMKQATSDKVEKFIKEKYDAKKVVIENIIDEKIKGGIIIKIGDEIIDASVDRQLMELKKELQK